MTEQKAKHEATYARDKVNGGWLVRVLGPQANQFAGREVPVLQFRSGETQMEKLEKLIWSGTDTERGKPVALYTFAAKPKEESEDGPSW